jgi:Fructose-bisphosphate aldolase class-I
MNAQELIFTAKELVADDKGLLAMDESNPTCNKRFAKLGIPQTEDAPRAYRELIVSTPDLCDSISGAILYDDNIVLPREDGGVELYAMKEWLRQHPQHLPPGVDPTVLPPEAELPPTAAPSLQPPLPPAQPPTLGQTQSGGHSGGHR